MKNLTSSSIPQNAAIYRQVVSLLRRLLGLLLLAVVVPLFSFRPSLTSTLTIPAGQQFQLGGGQLLGFTVVGKNIGPVPIQARELTSKGVVLERGTLAPGQKAELRFGAGSRALLLNGSTREGTVKVVVTGFNTSNLSMTYDKAGK